MKDFMNTSTRMRSLYLSIFFLGTSLYAMENEKSSGAPEIFQDDKEEYTQGALDPSEKSDSMSFGREIELAEKIEESGEGVINSSKEDLFSSFFSSCEEKWLPILILKETGWTQTPHEAFNDLRSLASVTRFFNKLFKDKDFSDNLIRAMTKEYDLSGREIAPLLLFTNTDVAKDFIVNDVNSHNAKEGTAISFEDLLFLAVKDQSKNGIRLMVRLGVPLNLKKKGEYTDTTPLLEAVRTGNQDLVKLCLELGAGDDKLSCYEAFKQAICYGENVSVVIAFIDAGMSIDTNPCRLIGGPCEVIDRCLDPLFHPLTVRLLQLFTLLGTKGDSCCFTPLHTAVKNRNRELINILVERGAPVNSKNHRLENCLHRAIRATNHEKDSFSKDESIIDIVKDLVELGADIHSKDVLGRTPLHVAAQESNTEVIEFLLSKGALVNSRDFIFNTPLDDVYHNLYGSFVMCFIAPPFGLFIAMQDLQKEGELGRFLGEEESQKTKRKRETLELLEKKRGIVAPYFDFGASKDAHEFLYVGFKVVKMYVLVGICFYFLQFLNKRV